MDNVQAPIGLNRPAARRQSSCWSRPRGLGRANLWLAGSGRAENDGAAPGGADGASGGLNSGGRARLLVVDDDEMVALTIIRSLKKEYDVESCSDARQALELLESGTVSFDLILCDLQMPGFGGIELFEALQEKLPHYVPRMVFITGGACTAESQAFLDRMPGRCLQKPFRPPVLREEVGKWLESVSAGAGDDP